ncbi:unnamed protein product [Bursaphelenchus xylophilus]|uniref:Ligand-gated ion channel 4 n=1 Tax=Bursaphelenchus xylophilus TaxID=6326 RepID=A0A1I7SMQ2_BURXY|nr:unnamed protein product [Bursaphelenchus xylophilus]CAG9130312.1 unnamed protein product [Bursaphelenchus xylophilus]
MTYWVIFLFLEGILSQSEDSVVSWKQSYENRQKGQKEPSLNFLDSILTLKDVNIQLGAVGPRENRSGNALHIYAQDKIWPSAAINKPTDISLAQIENALRLKSQAVNTEELLYKTLLDPQYYEQNVRPTPSHRLTTNITFGFLLNQIVEMDERNQKLTTRCWLNVNWLDKRLSWNATLWDGIKQIYIPYYKVWKPDIILVNNAVREYFESIMSTDVMVTHEGNVTWLFSALFKSNCAIKVRYYPFDEQECDLKFASWSHDMSEIDVGITTDKGDLSSYMNNSEFDLVDMKAIRTVARFPTDKEAKWPMIVIRIRMNRRPLFYVFNHILPCVLISSMALLGFFMPPETGEKINMLTTVLITVCTVSESITESIPPSSEAVPLIGMYYVASLFIVCLATTVNVVTLNVHRYGKSNQGRRVPYWLEKIVLGYMASMLFMTIHEPDSITLLKTSQSRLSTLRRSSLMRDLKKSKNLEYRKSRGREDLCECISSNTAAIRMSQYADMEIPKEKMAHRAGETAFLGRVVKDQLIPRIAATPKPAPMIAEFEERFKKILKRIYRSLQQHEIREEILDDRKRIMWQWQALASVMDRLLLVLFLVATLLTIFAFMIMPLETIL